MNETLKNIKEYLPLIVQITAIFLVLANIYLATQLSPITNNIQSVSARVDNLEQYKKDNEQLIPRFYQTEQRVSNLEDQYKNIDAKLDRLIERNSL